MKTFFDLLKGDKVIWVMVLFLSIISLLAVYSATGTIAQVKGGSYTFNFVLKHTGILLLGWVIMYVFHLIDYRYYSRIWRISLGKNTRNQSYVSIIRFSKTRYSDVSR
jgi:cell division protein FtsW